MQAFFQNFPKKFRGQSGGPGKAAAKIVLKRASADPSLSKISGDLAHLPYTPSQPSRTDSQCFSPGEASGNERPANCLWRSHRSHRSHRGQIAGVSLRVKRVITSAPRLARRRRKKTTCLHRWFFCVGENLFFRAVSSQVSSAPASLTSVFGMGTGGPSP